MGICASRWLVPIGLLGLAVSTLTPRDASAQTTVLERFAIRGEFGVGGNLSSYQHDTYGYGIALQGSGRIAFSLVDALAIQGSFTSWFLPTDTGGGQQFSFTLGLRLEPRLGSVGRLFLDANAGPADTVSLTRFTFDAGLGFEFALTRWLGLGPVVRYGLTPPAAQDYPSPAMFLTGGLSLAFRGPPPPPPPPDEPPPPDTDHDGIIDLRDLCPTESSGDRPDLARPGCPQRDRDGDGVLDGDDLCIDQPAGAHPDTTRRGCPATDNDHDGVYDPEDQCPTTPAGDHPDPDRHGCPDGDDDADTITNHADQCRLEPAGLHPDPARAGCPLPDRDHDSVPDATDHCPDRPGAPSPDPRRNGCPGLVRVENGVIHINRPVFFATNRDRILPTSRAVLQAVADAIRALPEIHRVSVEGHTDDVGDDARNLELSQRRADSVMAWLVAHAVEPTRIEAHGYGETRPLVPGHTNADRATNRRVEFHIVDPAPQAASGHDDPGAARPR